MICRASSTFRVALFDDLVVDNFAGGGGAGLGIERALGRPVDHAINHDAKAIAMHRVNHPGTEHWQSDVWEVDPREVARVGRCRWRGFLRTASISARPRGVGR